VSRREPFDIVVVGAGIVGSAAALAFARDGMRVALVEPRMPALWHPANPDLRVYALAQDSASLFEGLGVWTDIVRHAQAYRTMRVTDAAGGGELRFDAQRYGREALGWIVEHGLMADRLWTALQATTTALRCPQRLYMVAQDDADVVTLHLDDHSTLRARLVIAADGADSALRTMAGIGVARHDYGQRGLVAYVATTRPHEDTAWQRFLPTGPLAFLPCRDGRSSIVWTLPDAEAERLLSLDDTGFCIAITRAFDATLGEVSSVSKRALFPLRRQVADCFVHGRIALCGDAAHVVHPLAGQGLNIGLRDVMALRNTVRAATSRGADIGSSHGLSRWQRERRSESATAAYAFEGINRLFSNEATLPTLLRGPLLGIAGRLPGLDALLWKRAAGL
jgi:2-octaprenyl-3-methyl-6-methoxy-1,4-benzoquinol hydroxylase